MPISSTRYVDITSVQAGASAVPRRELVGLRVTSSQLVPIGSVLSFANADAVADYFGISSQQYTFAARYFQYVSPPPASRPNSLLFGAWAATARAPTVFSSEKIATLADLQAITAGTLTIQLGENVASLTGIDLSSAASLADVATELQAEIRAATGTQYALATAQFVSGQFQISGGIAEDAVAKVTATGLSGDLAPMLGLVGAGAVYSGGSDAQVALEAIQAIHRKTDSFGSFSFETQLGANDAEDVAAWNAGLNVKYMFIQRVIDATYASYSALKSIAGVGVVLAGTPEDEIDALPQAILAAINRQRRNAQTNFMFRTTSHTYSAVSNDADANAYDAERINYVGETARAGQLIQFFQRGVLGGNAATDLISMDVYSGEQWLKAELEAEFLNLLLTQPIVPAADRGRAMGLSIIDPIATQALENGTMITGKDLDANQRIAIESITGNDLAWHKVQSQGYWAGVDIVKRTNPNSGLTEYVLQYTLVYSANEGVRKVEGSHNVIV